MDLVVALRPVVLAVLRAAAEVGVRRFRVTWKRTVLGEIAVVLIIADTEGPLAVDKIDR